MNKYGVEDKSKFVLRLDPKAHKRIRALALKNKISMNSLISQIIDERIEGMSMDAKLDRILELLNEEE